MERSLYKKNHNELISEKVRFFLLLLAEEIEIDHDVFVT